MEDEKKLEDNSEVQEAPVEQVEQAENQAEKAQESQIAAEAVEGKQEAEAVKAEVAEEQVKETTPNEEEPQEEVKVDTGQKGKWYVIHVKTGYEGRVKEALSQRIKSLGVDDHDYRNFIAAVKNAEFLTE